MPRRANQALILLDALFKVSIVNIENVSKICEISYLTANALVKELEEEKILNEMTGNGRNRMVAFKSYLDVFFK